MNTEIICTGDGSYTLRNEHFGETYHSINGAVSESMHIFINLGLRNFTNTKINILEIGYGTGLNAILTFNENKSLCNKIFYHGIEKFPIDSKAFTDFVENTQALSSINADNIMKFSSDWNTEVEISPNFTLYKQKIDFAEFSPAKKYDLI